MYARLAPRASSPDTWDATFDSRSLLQERLALWRLRAGIDARWREMSRALAGPSAVVDVGCGLGTWAVFLAERGHDVYAVDFSLGLLRRTNERGGDAVRVCASTAEALSFRSGSLDAAFSWGVIEHDPQGPRQTLMELRRVVKPGGRVYVTVPLDSPRQRQAESSSPSSSGDVFYEYHFEPRELAEELKQAGFQAVTAQPITKSPHLAAPRLYRWLARRHPLLRDAGIQLLKPATWGRDSCFHMVLGTGMVPVDAAEATVVPT